PVDRSAIRDRAHHHSGLQGRDDQRPLADGYGDRLAGIPLPMLLLLRPLFGRDDAGLFAVEIDLRDLTEAEVVGPLGDFVDAESRADVVEEDVAGDFQRVL